MSPEYLSTLASIFFTSGTGHFHQFVFLVLTCPLTFQPMATYLTMSPSSTQYAVSIEDFNGDKHPDIAVANDQPGIVTILLGNENGTFFLPIMYSTTNGSDV